MHYKYSPLRSLRLSLGAICMSLALLLVCAVGVFAASVNVYDNAGVLNSGQVRSQAASLPYSIDIYTTKSFTGPKAQFGQEADQKMNRNGMVILAVDTVNKYIWIDGRGVNLTKNDYQNAANSFVSNFKSSSDYTSATNSAISSLSNAANNASSSGSKSSGVAPVPVQGGGINFGGACCIGLLVLAALGVAFAVMRGRRGRAGGGFPGFGGFRRNTQPPYDPNYNQPYNQPGYGPNYPQQGQGMNPWAAGGLGAAAGGLVGYELGKNEGERDNQGFVGGDQGNYDNSGGGAGADFGGGNDNSGGGAGADFGGGSGGDFGGGGDFSGGGGGGGGSDF